MAKVMKIDGPFNSRTDAQDFVEDIVNTEGYTLESLQFIKNGIGCYEVCILYDNGATASVTKKIKKVVVNNEL